MATAVSGRPAVLRSRQILSRDVLDSAGSKIGSIRDLLLDRRDGTIRYLEVDLGVLKKNVLVPIRHIEWGEDAFVLRGWTGEELQRLPTYEGDQMLTGEMLDELRWAYPRYYGDEERSAAQTALGEARVVPISRTRDFRIPKGEPDLRGWTLFGADGERAGKIDDLLVDPAAMNVAYLVVDLMDDLFQLKDDRHVLVPAAAAELRERGKDVWLRELSARDVARLPAYLSGAVDPLVLEMTDAAFERRA
jgi:sporulation protein YlmC with PRC-barrel domain